MQIKLPELSLIVMIGPSGSGKSSFAKTHFLPTEIVSSDVCRGMISDDENDQSVTAEAFDLVHTIISKRLSSGKLTVVDATNVQKESRAPLISIARQNHVLPVAIVFNISEKICQERNTKRADRNFGPHVIRQHRSQMRRSLKGLKREGFRSIYTLNSPEVTEDVSIIREPLWNNKKELKGPFDIIGDLHGCFDELHMLLNKLGYEERKIPGDEPVWGRSYFSHPKGRKALFLGDIVDRGPKILKTLSLVRNMVKTENALCVPGNHDTKFIKVLRGKKVQLTHGLDKSVAELDALPEDIKTVFKKEAIEFIYGLISHYVLDGGRLVIAHAGMPFNMQGRGSGKVREFALYGETTGEIDAFGLPVRYNWAADYRGHARVVYGHTPVPEPMWLNRTVNIDTGCVFGGKLTALCYPENTFVSIPAQKEYTESIKPFLPENHSQDDMLTPQQVLDTLLDAEDVIGKRIISTRLRKNITIREENATAALDVMSRFAADPKWLIYLPPTMSPCATSAEKNFLETPREAFEYYKGCGVTKVICEEKHMGSRAIVIAAKNKAAVKRRFGIENDGSGIIYTRTGRRFFNDSALESELIKVVIAALTKDNFWERFETDWVCLDCELMPWSAKALDLIKSQYASVGASATAALTEAISAIKQTRERTDLIEDVIVPENSSTQSADIEKLLTRFRSRLTMVQDFQTAYGNYCWTAESINDLKLAPFHILATEKAVHVDKDHEWHMSRIDAFCKKEPGILISTPYKIIDLSDSESERECTAWWEALTKDGGEGVVVKPFDLIITGKKGLIQPALKVRGKEYLRIIYGPEYTTPGHLDRLKGRGLGRKRSLALREFSLGIEALERFIRKEPLRRVHECVFGILALESEPIDPRL